MVKRRGGTKIGCLGALVIVGAIGYFGVNIGKHYWRYVEFRDRMQQEVRFAAHRPDSLILDRLRSVVDSLGLPQAAKNVRVKRANNIIFIYGDYYEHIEFPLFVKEIHFAPQAFGPF